MGALAALRRARAAGLSVTEKDGRLVVKGSKDLASLVGDLRPLRDEILAELECAEREAHRHAEGLGQVVLRPEDFKIRTVADLGHWDSDRPPRVCYACKRHRWWRGVHGRNWVCGHCVPPGVPPDRIVWSNEP